MPEPILLSVVVVTVATFVYKIVEKIIDAPKEGIKQAGKSTEELIQTIGSELRQTFNAQPIITFNTIVIEQTPKPICEWCFSKQIVEVREEFKDERWWPGSKKRLHISQMFTLKAGFDLNRVRLEFHKGSCQVKLVITDATIVNVEHHSDHKIDLKENGWWNQISTDEFSRVINTLPQKAKEDATKKELTKLATEGLTVFLGNFFKKFGCELEVVCQNYNHLMKDGSSLPEIPEDKLRSFGIVSEPKSAK